MKRRSIKERAPESRETARIPHGDWLSEKTGNAATSTYHEAVEDGIATNNEKANVVSGFGINSPESDEKPGLVVTPRTVSEPRGRQS
jgi:hypothetical protein